MKIEVFSTKKALKHLQRNGFRSSRHSGQYLNLPLNEQKLSFHSLRATVATHLHNRGVPLEEIQKQLFHSRPETTKLYCREVVDYAKSSVFQINY